MDNLKKIVPLIIKKKVMIKTILEWIDSFKNDRFVIISLIT